MRVQLRNFSFRFAEQVFNSRLSIKQEIETLLLRACEDLSVLGRPGFDKIRKDLFMEKDWRSQPRVSPGMHAYSKFDFMKERVAVEVQFGHASFLGVDLLKFQMASYLNLNLIDFGVYITTTKAMQKHHKRNYNRNWDRSLNYEKVVKYLPYFKSAIQVPIYVIGIDI